MSETAEVTAPKQRGVPFKPGVSGNPAGRPKGARSKFSEAFIQDLASIWEQRGIEVLQKCAAEQPGVFLRVCASLMPQDVNLNIALDPTSFANKFRQAVEVLGNEPPALRRRPDERDRACVDADDVAELRRMHAENGNAGHDLHALQSIAEVLAYVATVARQQNADEAAAIELVCRVRQPRKRRCASR